MARREQDEGFGAFFKRYARTWHHAVATAALTALGTLTVLHRLFAVLALLAYVLPPVVLYLRSDSSEGGDSAVAGGGEHDERGDQTRPAWTEAAVPTDESLTDVTVEDGRAYAVGVAGTVLCDDGSGWEVVVVDGPQAQSNGLAGVAATETGGVWVAGDNGTVARFDAETGRHVSYAEPAGDTTNVVALGAAGADGAETVLLADGSGRLRRGRYRDGEMAWEEPITPGSGSSVSGVVLWTPSTGYVCDTNQTVFRTTDGGRTADRIGLDAAGTPTDVAAGGADGCLVCDDSGVVNRYDGRRWTPDRLTDTAVTSVAAWEGSSLACGPTGAVFENDGDGWARVPTPATGALDAVALGEDRAVAVGPDGTVVERTAVQ